MHMRYASIRSDGFALLFGLALLSLPLASLAQPVGTVWRIAVLIGDRPGAVEALVAGLRELNYVEGKNIVFETRRYANQEQLEIVAAEVVRLKPDVIVVAGAVPARALSRLTRTIPIVMAASSDPIAQGVITSLARPGGNITGFTDMAEDLTAKRIEFVKQAAPEASRVAVLGCPEFIGVNSGGEWGMAQSVRERAGLTFVPAFIRKSDELAAAFANAMRQKVDAVLVLECAIMPKADVVTRLVNESRIPAIYPALRYAEAGGLMSYGPDTIDQYRRCAVFVDKILKGAKPADIPVEQPSKFLFVVNLKTARSIGLTVPQKLILRADRIIE